MRRNESPSELGIELEPAEIPEGFVDYLVWTQEPCTCGEGQEASCPYCNGAEHTQDLIEALVACFNEGVKDTLYDDNDPMMELRDKVKRLLR